MKKLIYLLPLFLVSCSPSFQNCGWIIPTGLILLGGYCYLRFKVGLFKPEAKGSKFAKICAIVLPIAGVAIAIAMWAAR